MNPNHKKTAARGRYRAPIHRYVVAGLFLAVAAPVWAQDRDEDKDKGTPEVQEVTPPDIQEVTPIEQETVPDETLLEQMRNLDRQNETVVPTEVDRRYIIREDQPGSTYSVHGDRIIREPVSREGYERTPPVYYTDDRGVVHEQHFRHHHTDRHRTAVVQDEPVYRYERTETVNEPAHGYANADDKNVDVDVAVETPGTTQRHYTVERSPDVIHYYPEPYPVYHRYSDTGFVPETRDFVVRKHRHDRPEVYVYRDGRYWGNHDWHKVHDKAWAKQVKADEKRFKKARKAERELNEDLRKADSQKDVNEAYKDYYEEMAEIEHDD